MVAGILRGYRGHVLLESAPGRGTRFRLLLPATAATSAETPPAKPTAPVGPATRRGEGATILVVDDEEDIRELLAELLTDAGYRAMVAESAEAALEMMTRDAPNPVAIVTDQSMPGMNGIEFAERVRKSAPRLPIILCTGYSPALSQSGPPAPAVDRILLKPVEPGRILDALSALLDAN